MDDEDRFEGDVSRGRAKPTPDTSSIFRPPSAANSKRVTARARAAWYNRSRGAGAVKLKHERPSGSQRVIVKIHPKVHAKVTGGAGSLMRHTLDGAGRDGDPVQVFDRELDRAGGAAFVKRCENDRHHFRVIIAPERGAAIDDLKGYTRDLMRTVESDLDTRIDWIAAEHHDTGRPHVHLLMRGVRADGLHTTISAAKEGRGGSPPPRLSFAPSRANAPRAPTCCGSVVATW